MLCSVPAHSKSDSLSYLRSRLRFQQAFIFLSRYNQEFWRNLQHMEYNAYRYTLYFVDPPNTYTNIHIYTMWNQTCDDKRYISLHACRCTCLVMQMNAHFCLK